MGRPPGLRAACSPDALCARGRARSVGGSGQGARLGCRVQHPDPPRHLRHGRDRAVRLRRRAEPAAARLATRARPGRQGAGRIRQRGRSGRDRARLPQRVRPLHGASPDRPERGSPRARPATGGGRAQPARPRAQRQLSGVPAAPSGCPRLLAVPRPAGERGSARALAPGRGHGRPRPVGRAAGAADPRPDRRRRAGAQGRRLEPLHLCVRPRRPALPDRRPCPARQPAHRRSARRDEDPDRAPAAHARVQEQLVSRRPGSPDPLPSSAAARARIRHGALAGGRAQFTGG